MLGVALQTVQTGLVALAWVAILRAAYPPANVDPWQVITYYAVAVALNSVLPANIGTLTMLFMFLALVTGVDVHGCAVGLLRPQALLGITDSTTAYSLGQQLVTRAWNLIVAVILVAAVFGWRGGKQLVGTSYRDAKGKVSELREQRRTRRDAASAE